MPSTYAHYIFGQQIRGRLSGYERKVIDKYPELFNIGLHGPDILFYYRPLCKNLALPVIWKNHMNLNRWL